ncbi:MOSC domain-containing protein [Cellulomonas humilata]|uniref:MOSC domain-containing protein n=1 Tax=Cellulomonas humilata TaxID=144055 RepID=A0A7Y5ZXZ9_9CELL|nr:MOSC N-terminal beta barrel domain-containing protein [Cellulomonas humilata]NUU16171.1 MOSC domain-containing protein [Cellulomonas humilata]
MRATTPFVSGLTVYPVKSFAGTALTSMELDAAGPLGDRRWMVIDGDGATLTARKHPRMLAAVATRDAHGVRLSADGLPDLLVEVPAGPADVPVQLSRLDTATRAGDAADAWCSELIGHPVRLVWLDDPARRGMSDEHGGTLADPLALTDTGPVHVTTTASLHRLDAWAAELHDERVQAALDAGKLPPEPQHPFDMRRFRPNLVVDGDLEPFAEDGWGRLVVGEVELRFADQCGRCVLTTIDPDTRVTGKEPLRTLARHRRRDGEVWFGIQMVPVRGGRVRVGDPVETTAR